MIKQISIEQSNESTEQEMRSNYQSLGEHLDRRGINIDDIKAKVSNYQVAVPSWGVGTGGTRFARFPGLGEPRHIFDKLDDCGVIQSLTQATPSVSLHIPWDKADASDLLAITVIIVNRRFRTEINCKCFYL